MQFQAQTHRSRALLFAAIASAFFAVLAVSAQRASADIANPQLSAGAYSTCSINANKRLYCWGSNSSTQLGQGSKAKISFGTRPYPVKGLTAQPIGVSVGYSSACSLLVTGAINCWGKNASGSLGVKNQGGFAKSAQAAASLISPWVAPSNQSSGSQHQCFRDNNATVKCIGTNTYGQLGNGSSAASNLPVQVAVITATNAATRATQVVSGANHACALLDNNNVKCWGVNNFRQLGTPTNTVPFSSTPVDVPNLTNNLDQLASMADHTCGVHTNGDVSCWGANSYGQLGDGTVAPFKGAVDVVSLGTEARQVSTGVQHTCALIKGGGVKCWGSNQFGQLGDSTTTTSSRPVSVIGLSRPASEISVGGYHSCARLDNNQIWCWGAGSKGQLGNGATANALQPVKVKSLGGVHFSSVGLFKTSGHANFQATFVAEPPRSGKISEQCRTNANLTVTIVQDGVTTTKKFKKLLKPSGSSKCTARFEQRSITKSVGSAQVTLKGSYNGTATMPGASFTQAYANP
ncbi:MAG: RCC1 domain-containing protein [Solirubrobacterales bacterium]